MTLLTEIQPQADVCHITCYVQPIPHRMSFHHKQARKAIAKKHTGVAAKPNKSQPPFMFWKCSSMYMVPSLCLTVNSFIHSLIQLVSLSITCMHASRCYSTVRNIMQIFKKALNCWHKVICDILFTWKCREIMECFPGTSFSFQNFCYLYGCEDT